MTNPSFLPNALLRGITATSYKRTKISGFYNQNHELAELDQVQDRILALENVPEWLKRIDPAISISDVSTELPWWLTFNPNRFLYWFGKPDPSNKWLLKAMQSGKGASNLFNISELLRLRKPPSVIKNILTNRANANSRHMSNQSPSVGEVG